VTSALLLVPLAIALPAEAASTNPGCGTARPSLDAIASAEGLVIGPDGTIYFTQPLGKSSSFLGRYRPPYTQPELRWLEVGPKALGTILDAKHNVLYVASRSRKKLLAVTLSEPPVTKELADVEPGINGATLGEDSNVYYTDRTGGHVYRISGNGEKTQVTTSPIEDPAALAFGPDARLYVLSHARARVTKVHLMYGKEIARAVFADLGAAGGKNADGIAFDRKGQLYVTATDLFRLSRDGKQVDRLGAAQGASPEFGVGPLACTDLYAAGHGKGLSRRENDVPGMSVPWHRLPYKETVPPPSPPPPAPAKVAATARLELITNETKEAVDLVAVPGEKVGRLFVVEKRGPIRILRGKTFAPEPFLDLTGQVSLWPTPNSEQGLLGLAFHPKYLKNGRFFINYTDLKGTVRIVEYHADKADPDRANPTPARELLALEHPYTNHNGGDLEFGPDGKLYVGLGDGGSGGDPHGNGQNPEALLGKMLRIDVDAAQPKPQVVARGLRNPWRYSFDRANGDLYIADVGQNLFEMVHYLPARKVGGPTNFGWGVVEAKHCYKADSCDRTGFTEAVFEYGHNEGCSITGGYVYRGKALPALRGLYFYSDYCTALLRSFRMKGGKVADSWDWKAALDPESQLANISTFGQDQDGELYVVTHEGPIFKLVPR
jgi:glucose/arabinose dehydrogenase